MKGGSLVSQHFETTRHFHGDFNIQTISTWLPLAPYMKLGQQKEAIV